MSSNTLVRVLGRPATIINGDPCVFDRWLWVRRRLRNGPLRTLDAGSGSGAFTPYAAKLGNEALGISFDERNNAVAVERARILGLPAKFLQGGLRKLDSLGADLGDFDQILCLETIEHIADDQKLVIDLARCLRPDGQPLDHPVQASRANGGRPNLGGRRWCHVRWGYTHDELAELFARAGLEVAARDFVNGWTSQTTTNLLRRLARANGKLAWLLTLPLRPLRLVDAPLTTLLGRPLVCVATVGVKPHADFIRETEGQST